MGLRPENAGSLSNEKPLVDYPPEDISDEDVEEDPDDGYILIRSRDYLLSDDSSDGGDPERPPSPLNEKQEFGSVLDRSELTLKEQDVITRKQFAPLPAKHKKWYDIICKILLKKFEKVDCNYGRLTGFHEGLNEQLYKGFATKDFVCTWADMGQLFFPVVPEGYAPFYTISTPVTDTYIRLICEYVKKVRIDPADDNISCAVMLEPHRLGLKKDLKKIFRKMNMCKSAFMNLDYLFIPYLEGKEMGAHYVFLGIAPKQQFSFAIDAVPGGYSLTNGCRKFIRAVLQHFASSDDEEEGDKNKKDKSSNSEKQVQRFWEVEEWDFFSQWQNRSKTTDESPHAPQQSDAYNCGMFALTSAFCLAFGFELLCYKGENIDLAKRPRIAAELYNGFSGEFAYDMFDLPAGRADRVGLPRPYLSDDEKDDEEGDPANSKATGSKSKAKKSKSTKAKVTSSKASSSKKQQDLDDDSEDDSEVYALPQIQRKTTLSKSLRMLAVDSLLKIGKSGAMDRKTCFWSAC
ncbi:hypothetical protein N431DRAFT_194416 [Stipitochalara longipes BDJ]|nr:hypothetical protein N431DRAFT_194416 [Stipitochalara longipes BDJ]